MEIFIQHQGEQTGPFSFQEIQAGVASGLYKTSDLVWHEGATGWMPLSNLTFIQREGKPIGPFSLQDIRAGVASGLYNASDLVWHQGAAGWVPLSHITQQPAGSPPLPAAGLTETSGLAIASMVMGISALMCGITAIPAVICGHLAQGKIKRSEGRMTGGGFAIAGLITGYIGILVLVASLAGLTAPLVLRQKKKADQTQAISNARQIGLALLEFEADYGRFPNAETAPLVAKSSSTPAVIGSSSNARFRQLFPAGITASEAIFYVRTSSTQKPDGDVAGSNALAPGECGFGYIENVRTDDGVPRPLAMAPFKAGSGEFDPMPFDNKAVILWSDNSVRSHEIDRATGEVMIDGRNLLDPEHPVWGGVPPLLLLPD
jgi:type II secretory pathway pseudopilin PulG